MSNPFLYTSSKRLRAEFRFKLYGLLSIFFSCSFLVFLVFSIFSNGISAFKKTEIRLNIDFSKEIIGTVAIEDNRNFPVIIRESLKKEFPDITQRRELFKLYGLISKTAPEILREYLLDNPNKIGQQVDIWLPASSDVDMWMKDKIDRNAPEHLRKLSDMEIRILDQLDSQFRVKTSFNNMFFTQGDSRNPEEAGVLGAITGSFFVLIVCMLISLPIGVFAAIYLEEFAPNNKFTDFIEININNLAAVPSIVFGLLGLAVYLNFFGMPRSSAIVGGLTLALLVLPTIVIATRTALKSVPPSIRDAARGLGASPMQVVFHHVVPLSMPGIITGGILGVARALGETAPLLMVGMVAFVVDVPEKISDPATVLPVQIFLWADSPELGFVEKTSAAIMILLGFLIAANLLVLYLRRKFSIRW